MKEDKYEEYEDEELEEYEDQDEELDEEAEYEEDSDDEEPDEEEEDELVMAPSSPIAYLKFMLNKENRKDKLGDMPSQIRSKVNTGLFLGFLILVLGVALCIVYKNVRIGILPAILSVGMFILAFKNYLDGATRQYITIRGTVVRSDYTKSILEMAKRNAQKTAKADFNYRSFIMKKDDDYIKIQCRKAKELPQEGDKLKVLVHAKTGVYEEDGVVQLMGYISIERVA